LRPSRHDVGFTQPKRLDCSSWDGRIELTSKCGCGRDRFPTLPVGTAVTGSQLTMEHRRCPPKGNVSGRRSAATCSEGVSVAVFAKADRPVASQHAACSLKKLFPTRASPAINLSQSTEHRGVGFLWHGYVFTVDTAGPLVFQVYRQELIRRCRQEPRGTEVLQLL
jgi:hypothetical protein